MSETMVRDALIPSLLAQARRICQQQDVPMLKGLEMASGWTADALMAAVGEQFGYDVLSMSALQSLQPDFSVLAYTECLERGVVLVRDAAGILNLVLANPYDGETEDWALRRWAGQGISARIVLVHPNDLQVYLTQQERQLHAMDAFDGDVTTSHDDEVAAAITLTSIAEETSPVIKLVHSTLFDALKLQASDIHLECDAGSLHVMYRLDGVLVPITQLQGQLHGASMAEQVISRIKVMAELDIAERRIPQDGRFKVRVNGRDVDFRVSIMPNIFGEDAVLRLLDRQSLTEEARTLRLDHLGLDQATMTAMRRLANKPHGMLLVTGPTGSGKTTTLYAAITEIHTGRDKIVTIEDPVEYRLPRVLQIPVNEKKGLTFARGLRSILRHDPDKIMVGEIRDDETAQIAVQAALTGHMVFTTVHANNVFDVVGRFLHMGVDTYSFAAALNGIVAQRLLRLNCGHCAQVYQPGEDELSNADLGPEQTRGWTFRKGRGCSHCRGTGYHGRKAVAEVLRIDDTLREMIAAKAPATMLKAHAAKIGMRPLHETALEWVARGDTTLEEVARVAG